MRYFLSIFLFHSFSLWSQVDTSKIVLKSQELKAVDVTRNQIVKIVQPETRFLGRSEIDLLQPTDLGDLFQKVEGVTLRSYGGLGGLKTVSMRGLGSQHTAINIDGHTQQSYQTGQVNLGQVQTDNIERVGLVSNRAITMNDFLPVSSLVKGNALSIQTFENQFSDSLFSMRLKMGYGSFNQLDSYGAVKVARKQFFVSGFGKYRKWMGITNTGI